MKPDSERTDIKNLLPILSLIQCPISKLDVLLENQSIVTADRRIQYPIIDGIICMLPDMAQYKDNSSKNVNNTTKSVQKFYDEIGWEQDSNGNFEDALRFEDLRPVSSNYIQKCHHRVRKAIHQQGKFLLDVASGPIQYDDYLEYHSGYTRRVCVDISITALRAARKKIKSKGIYILADITQMPFKENCFDAVVSLHTIYHVPFDRQHYAFEEIHRVLKPQKTAAVVYSWGDHSVFRRISRFPTRAFKCFKAGLFGSKKQVQKNQSGLNDNPLYSYQASPEWFLTQNWTFEYEVSSWRSLDVDLMKTIFQPWALGNIFLNLLFFLEEFFPKKMAVWGQYPLIKITKRRGKIIEK